MWWFFIAEINDILDDEPPQAHKTLIFFMNILLLDMHGQLKRIFSGIYWLINKIKHKFIDWVDCRLECELIELVEKKWQ